VGLQNKMQAKMVQLIDTRQGSLWKATSKNPI